MVSELFCLDISTESRQYSVVSEEFAIENICEMAFSYIIRICIVDVPWNLFRDSLNPWLACFVSCKNWFMIDLFFKSSK